MSRLRLVVVLVLAGVVGLGTVAVSAQRDHGHAAERAGEQAQAAAPADPAESLSPGLRQLLVEEMRLIDEGLKELLSAISVGEWETVEETAGKIQHSFILRQRLTDEQRHELQEKLPAGFLRMDVRFHEAAGKLVQTAHDRDAELASFYYSRLVDGCVDCHATFAPTRFPGLAQQEAGEHQQ